MTVSVNKTSWARLDPIRARLILATLAAAVLFCVAISQSPLAQGRADQPARVGGNDIGLYRAVAVRVHAGESYYAVTAEELPGRGYPSRSVFNWRTPLPVALIGWMPDLIFGKVLLCGLAALAMLFAFEFSAREGGTLQAATCALLMIGGLLPCFLGDLYVMPVLWAGALIVLSVCAFGVGRRNLGVAFGIVAVFLRDLAGPYCVFGLGWALYNRRFKEAAQWSLGLALYGVFFLWHCHQVAAFRLPDGVEQAESWVQFGGAGFVISAVQMNGFLLVLPQWISAIYLPLALLGFACWSSRIGQFAGLAAVAYIVLFSMIGQEFNQYWGSLLAPLLCLGAARAPLALRDLLQTARGDRLVAAESAA